MVDHSGPMIAEAIHRAPKAVLHDHLDGGLRPDTILELADTHGYRDLPTADAGTERSEMCATLALSLGRSSAPSSAQPRAHLRTPTLWRGSV